MVCLIRLGIAQKLSLNAIMHMYFVPFSHCQPREPHPVNCRLPLHRIMSIGVQPHSYYPFRSPSYFLLSINPHHIFVGLLFPSLCSAFVCKVCSRLSSRRDISSTSPCQPCLSTLTSLSLVKKHTLSKNLTRHPSKLIRQRIQQLINHSREFSGRRGICRCLFPKVLARFSGWGLRGKRHTDCVDRRLLSAGELEEAPFDFDAMICALLKLIVKCNVM